MESTKKILRQVLEDQAKSLFQKEFVTRMLRAEHTPGKATILTGVRRSGKSTLMEMIEKEYQGRLKNDHFLFLDFADERIKNIQLADLHLILEVIYEWKPETQNGQMLRIYFDEIQMVSGWELFIRRLLRDQRNCVYLSGSSAKLLSQEIATELRGRSLVYELFPFSFREYLIALGMDTDSEATVHRARRNIAMRDYLKYGSFPEVLLGSESIRPRILNDYFQVLLFRDLVERNRIEDVAFARILFKLLFSYYGSLSSINKIVDKLQSIGTHTSKQFVSKFLDWTEDCYSIFHMTIKSESQHKRNTNPKKIYVIDLGLVQYCLSESLENMGRKLENLVFLHLRRKTREGIAYYKTQDGREVDFLVEDQGERKLIQVCQSITDDETKKRELSALNQGMKELKLKESDLITLDETKEIKLDHGICHVKPLSAFLLEK